MKISDIEPWRAGIELQELASDITSLMARCKQAEEMVEKLQRKLAFEMSCAKDTLKELRELDADKQSMFHELRDAVEFGSHKARVVAIESHENCISVRLRMDVDVDKLAAAVFHTGAEFTARLGKP